MAKQFVGEEEELFFAICIVSEFDLFCLYFMSYFVKLNTGEFNQFAIVIGQYFWHFNEVLIEEDYFIISESGFEIWSLINAWN